MDIMELGAIGELVGGVAVIASLIYVGWQVRQSNRLAAAESTRAFVSEYNATARTLLNDRTSQALRKSLIGFDELTNDDKTHAHIVMTTHMMLAQASYVLGKQGLTHPDLLDIATRFNALMINEPGLHTWWGEMKNAFNTDFVTYLEETRSHTPRITEILPFFVPNREANGPVR